LRRKVGSSPARSQDFGSPLYCGGMQTHTGKRTRPRVLVLFALFCAFSFGAIVHVAFATSYHVTCVGHGFQSGSSTTDGSFFSRVQAGCGSTNRHCAIYTSGSWVGTQDIFDSTTTCNAWSRDFGNFTECASSAHVSNAGVFSLHTHVAPNWCG
jgi:hypothetical protein